MKKTDVKITVIITVHNAERYLRECLESVIAQTFSEIEILCVDGGSTDASPQILRQYAGEDSRIRIIDDPNTSYGHKVNRGVEEALGEYISVLESDDLYRTDMLAELYAVAEQYRPDFVNANYVEFMDVSGNRFGSLIRMYPLQDYNKLLESGKHPEDMRHIPRYWTGIFRRDFLLKQEIRMNESPGASYQDMSFRFLTSALADTCYHLDLPLYFYRKDNPNSSIYDPQKILATADEFNFLQKELERRGIQNIHIWRHFYIWKYNDLYGNLARFEGQTRKVLLDRCYRELKNDRTYLETDQEKQLSAASQMFLEKTPEELWEKLEVDFQNQRAGFQRNIKFYQQLKDYPVVIFGCGQIGKRVFDNLYLTRRRICCFADNNETLWHTAYEGVPIVPPDEAVRRYSEAFFVVANKCHTDQISRQLRELGIAETKIGIF